MNEPKDLWREIVRRGVEALGFHTVDLGRGDTWMAAEVARTDLASSVMTAAHAAIGMDKQVALAGGETPVAAARAALAAAIGSSPAVEELATYQALLTETLCRAVAHDPALALEAMAEPYE